jgi:hypothetical protein
VEAGAAVPPARINNRCSNASEVMLDQIHEALEFLQEPRRQYRVEGIPAAGVPKPSLERAATAGYFDDRQRNKSPLAGSLSETRSARRYDCISGATLLAARWHLWTPKTRSLPDLLPS